MADFQVGKEARMGVLRAMFVSLRAMLLSKAHLAIENLALRQQLAVCRQSRKVKKLSRTQNSMIYGTIGLSWAVGFSRDCCRQALPRQETRFSAPVTFQGWIIEPDS